MTLSSGTAGTLNISAGTITGNLTVDAANATVNNAATVSGTITINNVSGNTWNENASGNTILFNDTDAGTNLVIGAGQTVANLTLNGPANVTVPSDATVSSLTVAPTADGSKIGNAGTILVIGGTGSVEVSGNGTVLKSTNENVTTGKIETPDQKLTEVNELVEAEGIYSSSFTWESTNGIGTKLVEKSGRYNYFSDGAYLDITVKNESGTNLAFNTLFDAMTLQTDGGSVDEIQGTAGRQLADWNGVDTGFYTKLKVAESKSVFYGVRQTGQTTAVGMTRTVGFNAGDSRKIDLALTPKAELEAGTYTITIQPKQQVGVTSGVNLGNAITYTITIPSLPVE